MLGMFRMLAKSKSVTLAFDALRRSFFAPWNLPFCWIWFRRKAGDLIPQWPSVGIWFPLRIEVPLCQHPRSILIHPLTGILIAIKWWLSWMVMSWLVQFLIQFNWGPPFYIYSNYIIINKSGFASVGGYPLPSHPIPNEPIIHSWPLNDWLTDWLLE